MRLARRQLVNWLALAGLGCLAGPAPVAAQEMDVAGVKMPVVTSVGGASLQLNGAGVRYKFVKVYAAGLYLGKKTTSAEDAMAQPGPKRVHVVMLREVNGSELGKLFSRGIEDNTTGAEFPKLIPGVIRMGEIFSTRPRLMPGESFSVDWLPGTGMVVLVNGKPVGQPIVEPEFYRAMLRIWLGKSPAEATLKAALLGTPQAGVSTGNI